MQPLISVIIPVYKTENYLERCVNSLTTQSYSNLEIILVDDGSPDGAPELCDKLSLRDDRIHVIHKQNGGVSSARNAGIKFAKGEYIGFVDSDDFADENFYSDLYELIIANEADIASCAYRFDHTSPEVNKEVISLSHTEAISHLLSGKKISYSVCDKLFSQRTVKELSFSEKIKHNEDFLFVFQALKNSKKIVYTNYPYYCYCENNESATHSVFNKGRMTAIDAQEAVLRDVEYSLPDIYPEAVAQFLKVNLYNASQMVADSYADAEDKNRLRQNVKKYKKQLIKGSLALGYKLEGLILIFSQRAFDLYIKCIGRMK